MKSIFSLVFLSLIFIIQSCDNINKISAGSYPYSEKYIVKMSESELIGRINKFKENNPEYKVSNLEDHRISHLYHVYFYLTNKNKVFSCWTRPWKDDVSNISVLALDAVRDGIGLGNWKTVNTKDLTKEENEEIKQVFKENILSKLNY